MRISPWTIAIFAGIFTMAWAERADAKVFCFQLDKANPMIWDASPRAGIPIVDYGEDFGRKNSNHFYLPFMEAHIETMSGVQVFGGTGCGGACYAYQELDQYGCTGSVVTPNPGGSETFKVVYRPIGADDSWTSTVWDCSSTNPLYPGCSIPIVVVNNVSVVGNVTHYLTLGQTAVNWLYWSISQTMSRFPIVGDVNVDYYDPVAAGGLGTGTIYDHGGEWTIRVTGNGYRSKFTVAHEYGHVVSLFNQFTVDYDEFDYCYNSASPCQHTVTSKEYQHIAASEGFGNFFSTALWNNYAQPSTRFFGQPTGPNTGNVWNAEVGAAGQEDRYYETNGCSPFCTAGVGVELDWMRAFWDFYTDTGSHPSILDIADVFGANYPFVETDLTDEYYEDFVDAVYGETGISMGSRFVTVAQANGIDH